MLFVGVPLCLWIMPEPIRVLVGLLALLLLLVAGLFGRVICTRDGSLAAKKVYRRR